MVLGFSPLKNNLKHILLGSAPIYKSFLEKFYKVV
jgi:hypothetical protein